jgi:hypothetical protein
MKESNSEGLVDLAVVLQKTVMEIKAEYKRALHTTGRPSFYMAQTSSGALDEMYKLGHFLSQS